MGEVRMGGAIVTASDSEPWFLLCSIRVALILYLDLIKAQWFPIVTATVVSTLLVLVVTGQMHQLVIKFERRLMAMDLLHHRARAQKMKKVLEETEEVEAMEEAERIELDKALLGQDDKITKKEEK